MAFPSLWIYREFEHLFPDLKTCRAIKHLFPDSLFVLIIRTTATPSNGLTNGVFPYPRSRLQGVAVLGDEIVSAPTCEELGEWLSSEKYALIRGIKERTKWILTLNGWPEFVDVTAETETKARAKAVKLLEKTK